MRMIPSNDGRRGISQRLIRFSNAVYVRRSMWLCATKGDTLSPMNYLTLPLLRFVLLMKGLISGQKGHCLHYTIWGLPRISNDRGNCQLSRKFRYLHYSEIIKPKGIDPMDLYPKAASNRSYRNPLTTPNRELGGAYP